MPRKATSDVIRLRGVRHNNLKNLDLDLPKGRLIVFTGLSGSGKSSLAFDTLFAEGQRRYVETFSPYVRQFFDRMDKPQVDRIDGIPPAIALGQRNTVRTTRSTIGTMTEICDHMKHLWTHLAQCHCDRCGAIVARDEPLAIWEAVSASQADEVLVTFDVPLAEKISLEESLQFIGKQGYQRILDPTVKPRRGILPEVLRVDEAAKRLAKRKLKVVSVVQDRVRLAKRSRARFLEAIEQAYQFGKGHLAVHSGALGSQRFSRQFHCAACDVEYRDPSPSLFSFNNPIGACPDCRGFGRIISIDYRLALPDMSLSIADGVVKPWQTKTGAECQRDMMRAAKRDGIQTDVPFRDLSKEIQNWVIHGEPDYGKPGRSWPNAWYGVAGYFRWLESKAYKMHVRVLLSRYRAYTECPACRGHRFKPESLRFRLDYTGSGDRLKLSEFYRLPIRDAAGVVNELAGRLNLNQSDALSPVLESIWESALRAPEAGEAHWLHGDLHAQNVLVDGSGRITAVIDWGDITGGDPATDLAGIWAVFPTDCARQQILESYRPDAALLQRAMGWAFVFGVVLTDSGSINSPRHAAAGRRILERLEADSA